MISEELKLLIDAAVSDGIVTDKELEIISRRAKTEDIDMDELMMYIEGKLSKQRSGNENEKNLLVHRLFNYLEKTRQMNAEERQARRELKAQNRETMFKLRAEKSEQRHRQRQERAAFDAEHPEVFENKVKTLTEAGTAATNLISGIAALGSGPGADIAKGLFDVFKKK